MILRMSNILCQKAKDDFAASIKILLDVDEAKKIARDAEKWINDSIEFVRNANEPNPYKYMSDDEICEKIPKNIRNDPRNSKD